MKEYIQKMKSFALIASILLLTTSNMARAAQTTCNAHLEITNDDDQQISFNKMTLEVYSPTGSRLESSQCTPDGNCFVVVYNTDQFTLKMKGPQGSVFEPSEYKVGNGANCDDITFKLKGFSLKFAVKT